MWWKVTYNTHGSLRATSGLLEFVFEAENRDDAFHKIQLDGIIPRSEGERVTYYDVIPLDYTLPEDYEPIPFDEVEAAL